jgi:hypothetical protein
MLPEHVTSVEESHGDSDNSEDKNTPPSCLVSDGVLVLTHDSREALATLADPVNADAVVQAVTGTFGCNIFVHERDIGALMNL